MSTHEPVTLTAAATLPIIEELEPDPLFASRRVSLTLLGGDDEPDAEIQGAPDEMAVLLSAIRASMRAASL